MVSREKRANLCIARGNFGAIISMKILTQVHIFHILLIIRYVIVVRCQLGVHCIRLDFQPLFGKRARAPSPNSLFGEERRPHTRERRKSSLTLYASDFDRLITFLYLTISIISELNNRE